MRNARVLDDFKTNNDVRGGMALTIYLTHPLSVPIACQLPLNLNLLYLNNLRG